MTDQSLKTLVCNWPYQFSPDSSGKLCLCFLLECQATNGKDCIFPFILDGETYSSCYYPEDGSESLCAIRVNANGVARALRTCSEECESLHDFVR